VPDLYFTKYPVTNKQYRRFIDFIAGAGNERLKLEKFVNSLRMFANHSADGFISYLSRDAKHWAKILCSRYADNHRFSGDDQPVVGVTWFAAQAYCWWLSEMQGSWEWYYRLPTENEWEWSASGGKRKYPWGNEEPDDTRANYGDRVGCTTPVSRYPSGATPEGLMDMAGNVWEWTEDRDQEDEAWRALRGGSGQNLRCVSRFGWNPDSDWDDDVGFRVVYAKLPF